MVLDNNTIYTDEPLQKPYHIMKRNPFSKDDGVRGIENFQTDFNSLFLKKQTKNGILAPQ